MRADALLFLAGAEPFDVALVDPPYEFDRWSELLATAPTRLIVLESGRDLDVGGRWEVLRRKRYGGTVVTMVQPADG